jgi:hypothetical protein
MTAYWISSPQASTPYPLERSSPKCPARPESGTARQPDDVRLFEHIA